jgi:hypothetical protein
VRHRKHTLAQEGFVLTRRVPRAPLPRAQAPHRRGRGRGAPRGAAADERGAAEARSPPALVTWHAAPMSSLDTRATLTALGGAFLLCHLAAAPTAAAASLSEVRRAARVRRRHATRAGSCMHATSPASYVLMCHAALQVQIVFPAQYDITQLIPPASVVGAALYVTRTYDINTKRVEDTAKENSRRLEDTANANDRRLEANITSILACVAALKVSSDSQIAAVKASSDAQIAAINKVADAYKAIIDRLTKSQSRRPGRRRE